MWNMRLMKRASAGLTLQFSYKFCGWNKGTRKRKSEVMKECWEMKRTRQKHLLITFKVGTLGKHSLSALCAHALAACTCCQRENLVWKLATAVTPDPQHLIGESHGASPPQECLPHVFIKKVISQTVLTLALAAQGASTLFPPSLQAPYTFIKLIIWAIALMDVLPEQVSSTCGCQVERATG